MTRTAERRAVVSSVLLFALWAAAFRFSELAFFPLIAVGGIVTGLAGLWVREGTTNSLVTGGDGGGPTNANRRETSRPGPLHTNAAAVELPQWALTGHQALLVVAVAVAHLVAAHVLFDLGTWVLPQLAPTAEQVYGRTGEVSLWWAVLLGGVVTAPLEEVYWRGAILPLLLGAGRGRWPGLSTVPGVGTVAGAVAYALFHVSTGHLALVAAALLGGLVWGWLLEHTGSLGAPMLAHGLWACGMLLLPPV